MTNLSKFIKKKKKLKEIGVKWKGKKRVAVSKFMRMFTLVLLFLNYRFLVYFFFQYLILVQNFIFLFFKFWFKRRDGESHRIHD